MYVCVISLELFEISLWNFYVSKIWSTLWMSWEVVHPIDCWSHGWCEDGPVKLLVYRKKSHTDQYLRCSILYLITLWSADVTFRWLQRHSSYARRMDDDSCVMKYIEIVPLDDFRNCSDFKDVKQEPVDVKVCVELLIFSVVYSWMIRTCLVVLDLLEFLL